MARYFGATGEEAFVFFSPPHWIGLGVLTVIYIGLWYSRDYFKQEKPDRVFRVCLAAFLWLQEIALIWWKVSVGIWDLGSGLPLHLCGMAIVISPILLMTNRFPLYELVYFWGLGGAIQALLTPDIGEHGFPHFRYFQFFVSHGLIILAGLYMTWVGGMRPTQRSIWKTWVITNIYMVPIALFNLVFDGNYLFICYKPEAGSIMDLFGPWPWYILVLEVVAIVSFYIYYAPFAVMDLVRRFRRSD